VTPTFHLYLPQMRMAPDVIVDRARRAETAGFEGIAFMDHLAPPLATNQDMWEAMTIAGWVLARTDAVVVGHLVLCDALRHPAVLARQVTTLDHASDGRFELGIGWGSVPSELDAFGVGAADAVRRAARLDESLRVMRRLWTGEVVDHRGEHFVLEGAQQRPVPTRRIPILVGGVGERTLALVRDHADWWNVPVHHLHRREGLRDRVGHARVSIQTMVALVATEDQRDDVHALVERRYGGTPMGETALVGTTGELAHRFAGLHAEGVERFYIWFADFAAAETLERFAEVIAAMPAA
jgi:alkanesulfonate monooxygenase SsuD/methylene tetrahydromethanopterin reductase-like flavin-dependent oxidoreductase (luciferase family)